MMEIRSPFTGRRGVCLPFSDFCDPLIFDEYESRIGLQKLAALARERNWKYFEVRSGETHGDGNEPASTFYGHELDLRGGLAEVTSRFASSVRRAIRKGEKSALVLRWIVREQQSRILRTSCPTRRRHGIPPQPLSFFLNIHESILKPGRGFHNLAVVSQSPLQQRLLSMGKECLSSWRLTMRPCRNFEQHRDLGRDQFLVQQNAESLHFRQNITR